jgi:hypothetical protein
MMDRREFLVSGAALATPAVLLGGETARKDWFRRQARVFLLDFQVPDPADQGVPGMPHFFQKLDSAAIVEQVAASGANVLLVHAKCNQGNAYYNTKVGHKHSDLGERDLMAEFSAHCRKRGITILYYVQLSRDRRSFDEHPERRAIDAQGHPVSTAADNPLLPVREERQVVCMNGPHRQFIKDILAELGRGYDFDGFWLDCYSWWGKVMPCFCDFCKTAYRHDTGSEIPKGGLVTTAEGKRYVEWRRRLNTTILKDVLATVRGVNPSLTVTHNGSASKSWADWEFCDADDYVSNEYHFSEGYGNLSLLCRRNWSLKPGAPFEVEIWRFANRHGGSRSTMRAYQVRPPETLLAEMASVVANGGFPQYYDQVRPDGTLETKSLKALAPAFREVAARQRWAGVGKPVPYAAVLWSKATEALAPREAQTLHEDSAAGTFHALMESHLPVSVISERDAAAGEWRGARVVIVDAAECLPRDCAQALERFAGQGGGLVITGRSALRDGQGRLLENFGLSELAGADFLGMTEKWYGYVNPEKQHPITAGLTLEFPISVYETLQARVRAHAGTEALATIVNPMPGFQMGYPPHERTGAPALLISKHGKGRVVYAAAPLGAVYYRFNHPDNQRLIVNAAQWAAGSEPPVWAQAPGTVEATAWHDDKARRTVIHLVNRTGAGLPQGEGEFMHEAIPVYGVKVHLDERHAGRVAKSQPSGRVLPVHRDGNGMTVTVERLNIWEVLEIT